MESPAEGPRRSQDSRIKELERSELWSQLTNCINLRSAQDQVLWSITGIFWAANAILLVALFARGDLPKNPFVGVVLSGVGMVMSITWYVIQQRALGHVKRYEELMRKLENKLSLDPQFAISAEINRQDYERYLGKGWRARKVMPRWSIGGTIFWFFALGFFIWRLVSKSN